MKIKISNKIRLVLVTIFTLILLFSTISVINAYQKPTTVQTEVNLLQYSQIGNYNYIAYLNESLLYEGKEILRPGEGTIFRDIIKNINASFVYTLFTNDDSEISGNYTITAQIQTNLWNKTFTIISKTPINSNGTVTIITEQFPIDYIFYENIVSEIEDETNIAVTDSTLIILTNIAIEIKKDNATKPITLKPTLSASLNKKTIDIEIGTETNELGNIVKTYESTNQDVINERSSWAASSLIFLFILILSIILTKSGEELSNFEKENKKIMKKYKEWIVEIKKEPKRKIIETIKLISFEDILKISEELGKPIFHYTINKDIHHYLVFDETMTYEFTIGNE